MTLAWTRPPSVAAVVACPQPIAWLTTASVRLPSTIERWSPFRRQPMAGPPDDRAGHHRGGVLYRITMELSMSLEEAMRTQRAIRRLKTDPVDDALVLHLIELA